MSHLNHTPEENTIHKLARLLKLVLVLFFGILCCMCTLLIHIIYQPVSANSTAIIGVHENNFDEALLAYGKELIVHTSMYLGPNGSVAHLSNGMNCQNCHLQAGTKPFGNNYLSVAATFPKFRPRIGSLERIEQRINDCMCRSINGQNLNDTSLEMRAMVYYINHLGRFTPIGQKDSTSGIPDLPLLNRSADPIKGKNVYVKHCITCHQTYGQGKRNDTGDYFQYPPLFGPQSFNVSAGLYRLSKLAGYIKFNMPFGVTYNNPKLSDEEVWDVAAFIVSQPRPETRFIEDWPDITLKPMDHPFKPYSDTFTEHQHKYGPFKPILASNKKPSKH